jgi:hypothetical protein
MTPATATAMQATATPASTTPAVTPRLPASTARARRCDLAAEMRSQENTSAAQQPRTGAVMVETPGQGRDPKR